MQYLAHRGIWSRPEDRNSRTALLAALRSGFGIETDFRDLDGQLVVSHDPPRSPVQLSANELFEAWASQSTPAQTIAANIKADGLVELLRETAQQAGLGMDRIFAFDMSVPDSRSYMAAGVPFYTRTSEFEPVAPLLEQADGIWVDAFTADFAQVAAASALLDEGHSVAFVSPELHGRDFKVAWEQIREAGLHLRDRFAVCTDHPERARKFFGGTP